MAVMAKAAAGSTLIEFVKDLEEGAVVYSAEFTGADGKLMEVTVSKDAVLLDVSPEVDEAPVAAAATPGASAATPAADTPDISVTARDLPAPAMAAMTKAAGRFPLVDFVRAVDSGKTVFSAEFTDATGTIMEVTVTKEGELLDVSPEVEEPVTPLRGR
jgi:hypothetical protein